MLDFLNYQKNILYKIVSKFRMYIFFLKVIGLDNMSNKNVQKIHDHSENFVVVHL